LPEGFQRSEFLQEHGAIDMIIDRREMRDKIASVLAMLTENKDLSEVPSVEPEIELETETVLVEDGAEQCPQQKN